MDSVAAPDPLDELRCLVRVLKLVGKLFKVVTNDEIHLSRISALIVSEWSLTHDVSKAVDHNNPWILLLEEPTRLKRFS
jgi:hypothetical protein